MLNWMLIAKAGIVAGAAKSLLLTIANMLGFSRIDLASYLGCLVSGNRSGMTTFLAGVILIIATSIALAFVYAIGFDFVKWNQLGWIKGAAFGLVNWVLAGIFLPMLDSMNNCVKNGSIAPMKMFGLGYGSEGALAFLLANILFGGVIGFLIA